MKRLLLACAILCIASTGPKPVQEPQTTGVHSSGATAGVASFNTRTGAVSLTSADITGALAFTPLNPASNLADVASTTTALSNLGGAKKGAATASGLTMSTATLLGRTTAATGAIEEITVGSSLSLASGQLKVVGLPNGITFNSTGAGDASGISYTGSINRTVSYNTIGAQVAGTYATGTGTASGTNTGDETSATILSKLTGSNIATSGSVLSSGTAGIGYTTGAGGTVTQATSRTTGVTLSKISGEITLFSKTTTAGLTDTFTVTNTLMAATDSVILNQKSGSGVYFLGVTNKAAGSFKISVYTPTAVGSAEAPVISFTILKSVAN